MIDGIPPLNSDLATMNALPALSAKLGATTNIDKAAQDFEAMFATQLIQPMFSTVHVDETFGGGHGEEVMRSFMLQEYGKMIAKTGRLGIASQVKAEMLRAQEAAKESGGSSSPTKERLAAQVAYANTPAKGADYVSH